MLTHKNFFEKLRKLEKLNLTDQIYISRQLSVLMRSGLTLSECLVTLADESHSKKIGAFFGSAVDELNRGETLSNFMSKKYSWRPLAIALVRVGEASGSLGDSFGNIADELYYASKIRKKLIGAFIYPACVAVFALVLIIGVVSFIFPKIIPVIQSLDGELPISTRTVIFLADFLKNHGIWLVLFALIFTTSFVVLIKKFPVARIFVEKFIIRLPLFGGLYKSHSVAHIAKSISVLTSSETNLVEALDIATLTVPSIVYRQALEIAKEKVIHGERLSEALGGDSGRLFPKTALNLLAMGERTGSLSSVCGQIADMYSEQFESDIETVSKMIEPALMIALGLAVGFIAISIITPIYEITSNVRK